MAKVDLSFVNGGDDEPGSDQGSGSSTPANPSKPRKKREDFNPTSASEVRRHDKMDELFEKIGMPSNTGRTTKSTIAERFDIYTRELEKQTKKKRKRPEPVNKRIAEAIGDSSPGTIRAFKSMMKEEYQTASQAHEDMYGEISNLIPPKVRSAAKRKLAKANYDIDNVLPGYDTILKELQGDETFGGTSMSESELESLLKHGIPRKPGATSDVIIEQTRQRWEREQEENFKRIRERRLDEQFALEDWEERQAIKEEGILQANMSLLEYTEDNPNAFERFSLSEVPEVVAPPPNRQPRPVRKADPAASIPLLEPDLTLASTPAPARKPRRGGGGGRRRRRPPAEYHLRSAFDFTRRATEIPEEAFPQFSGSPRFYEDPESPLEQHFTSAFSQRELAGVSSSDVAARRRTERVQRQRESYQASRLEATFEEPSDEVAEMLGLIPDEQLREARFTSALSPAELAAAAGGSGGGLPPGGGGGGGPPDDLGGEDLPREPDDPDELERQLKQQARIRKAQQDLEFKRIGREALQRDTSREQELRQRRQGIHGAATAARGQLAEQAGRRSSDRIVRRLGTFGIARSMGGSGQIFAGLMELGVFQPEERRSDQQSREQRELISQQEQAQIESLNYEQTLAAQAERERQAAVRRVQEEQGILLRNADTPEERERILEDTRRMLGSLGGGGGPGASGPGGGVPGGGGGVPGGPAGGGGGPGPGGPGGPGVPGGGGPPPGGPAPPAPPPGAPPGGQMPPGSVPPIPAGAGGAAAAAMAFHPLTAAVIGTAVAMEGMRQATDAAARGMHTMGEILSQDVVGMSPGGPLGVAGGLTTGGARAAGFFGGGIGGAALGTAVGGPVGGIAGFALGGALGSGGADMIVRPIVSAVEAGNKIMENFTDRSIGAQTLTANVEEELTTFFARLEAEQEVDPITAEFSRARGDLQRSMLELQTSFIDNFGDDVTNIVKLLTKVVDWLSDITGRIPDMEDVGQALVAAGVPISGIPGFGTIIGQLLSSAGSGVMALGRLADIAAASADTLEDIDSRIASELGANGRDIFDEIEEFHSQSQFFDDSGHFKFKGVAGGTI